MLYGIGSRYVYEMVEVAARAQVEIAAFINNLQTEGNFYGLNPVLNPDQCDSLIRDCPAIIPLVTPGHRRAILHELAEKGFTGEGWLIDPTATIAGTVLFGNGFQVNAGVVIGAHSQFGEQVLVNRSASIGHDTRVEDFVSFGPGCVTSAHMGPINCFN